MCWAQRNGLTILSRSLSLLQPLKSHQGTVWAVRKASPSNLFPHNLRMLAILENGRNLILLMCFSPYLDVPTQDLFFKEGTALGVTHILRPRIRLFFWRIEVYSVCNVIEFQSLLCAWNSNMEQENAYHMVTSIHQSTIPKTLKATEKSKL